MSNLYWISFSTCPILKYHFQGCLTYFCVLINYQAERCPNCWKAMVNHIIHTVNPHGLQNRRDRSKCRFNHPLTLVLVGDSWDPARSWRPDSSKATYLLYWFFVSREEIEEMQVICSGGLGLILPVFGCFGNGPWFPWCRFVASWAKRGRRLVNLLTYL